MPACDPVRALTEGPQNWVDWMAWEGPKCNDLWPKQPTSRSNSHSQLVAELHLPSDVVAVEPRIVQICYRPTIICHRGVLYAALYAVDRQQAFAEDVAARGGVSAGRFAIRQLACMPLRRLFRRWGSF